MTTPTVQPRTRRFHVEKLSVIRSAIAGYAGGTAITRELVQNADDARSEWLEFYLSTDRLVVRNGSKFSGQDFDAICNIASGNKREDHQTTGTWGTGFLSVYQIADCPELHSAGTHLVFDPTCDDLPEKPSPVTDHTEFHFPWRTEKTQISREIDAEPWPKERIESFEQEFGAEIRRVLLFLQHLKRITVYQGLDRAEKLYEVRRERTHLEQLPSGIVRELWRFRAYDHARGEQTDDLTIYRRKLGDGFYNSDGREIKRREVAFAHGLGKSWFGEEHPGSLYNTLPTGVRTGFAFHINGDFFPNANRTSILADRGAKGDWNRKVIHGIADLFVVNLERIRDECSSPEAFYGLFPIKHNEDTPWLEPIVCAFQSAAGACRIIQTTDDEWTEPRSVRRPGDLRPLCEEYLPAIAPRGLSRELQSFLQKELGAQKLTLKGFLEHIQSVVPGGTCLIDASPVINSREKLDAIFDYIAKNLDRAGNPLEKHEKLSILDGKPIFLNTKERLWIFSQRGPWLADEATRAILPAGAFRLLDLEFQERHKGLLCRKMDWIDIHDIVRYLEDIAPDCAGRTIDEGHVAVNSVEKLRAIYDYLIERKALDKCGDLSALAICLDEQRTLHKIGSAPYPADEEVRTLLDGADVCWISPQIQGVSTYTHFLEESGVPRMTPRAMISLLHSLCPGRQLLADAPSWMRSPERLRALYRYFHRHARDLTEEDRTSLRRLPFVLTQHGALVAIEDPAVPLSLPPDAITEVEDILNLDNLISDSVLDVETRPFFESTLRVNRLTLANYIDRYVIDHYHDIGLSDDHRMDLLRLIRREYPSLREPGAASMLDKLRETRLIRCADNRYRQASDVYFPSDFLDSTFPAGYAIPHEIYEVPTAATESGKQNSQARPAYYDSVWYALFSVLDMRDRPKATDLVESVRKTLDLSPHPTETAVQHIRRLFDLLNRKWQDEYHAFQSALEPLRAIPWLPAEKDGVRWYQPRDLYPISLKVLIESQARLIPFPQANREFSDFLGLNVQPRPQHVVNHLLRLSEHGEPVDQEVYRFLNRLDEAEIQSLKGQPVIYDRQRKRYWLPKHVYSQNLYSEFGPYRCYLSQEDLGDWWRLFKHLGVRERVDPIADYVDVLVEISLANHGKPINQEDQRLINKAFVQLAERLGEVGIDTSTPKWIRPLQVMRIVIDQGLHLLRPDQVFFKDQPVLLEKFPEDAVRWARFTDERARPLLIALGVRPLSQVVSRRPIHIKATGADEEQTNRMHFLIPQFRRLVEHFRKDFPDGWVDLSDLQSLKVFGATGIKVQYIIEQSKVQLGGKTESLEAYYDQASNRLFRLTGTDMNPPLAREVATVLNPSLEPAKLGPILLLMLTAPLSEVDRVLDSFEIRRSDVTPEQLSMDEVARERAVTTIRGTEEAVEDTGQEATEPIRHTTEAEEDEEPPSKIIPTTTTETNDEADDAEDTETARLPLSTGETEKDDGLSIPPFTGQTRPTVPVIPTNYADLRAKYGVHQEQGNTLESLGELLEWEDGADNSPDPLKSTGAFIGRDDVAAHSPGDPDRRVECARFTLSFMNRYEGFLSLTGDARALLVGQSDVIDCSTDFNHHFPLYIDHDELVIYNQEALPRFFAAQDIPAGGVVYLAHVHGSEFRLYYKDQPHEVHNVRIATLSEDGQVQYTVLESVHVPCETDDFVFRADKRLEDAPALFREAISKKSIFETMCDIFAECGEPHLHQEELFNRLSMVRMVSSYSVTTELRDRPCFIDEGGGYWRFDSSRGLERDRSTSPNTRSRTISRGSQISEPSRSTSTDSQAASTLKNDASTPVSEGVIDQSEFDGDSQPSGYDPIPTTVATEIARGLTRIADQLREFADDPAQGNSVLQTIRVPFDALARTIEDLSRRQPQRDDELVDSDEPDATALPELLGALLNQLQKNPADEDASRQFQAELDRLLSTIPGDAPEQHPGFLAVLRSAEKVIWEAYILPVLEQAATQAEARHSYDRALNLVQLIERFMHRPQQARWDQITRRKEAYELLSLCDDSSTPEDELAILADALQLDPDLGEARERYDAKAKVLIASIINPVDEHLKQERVNEASKVINQAVQALDQHEQWVQQPERLRQSLYEKGAKVFEHALDDARHAAEYARHPEALDAYHLVARHFLVLPEAARRHRIDDYLEALYEIGTAYDSCGQNAAAIIALERAITFADETVKVGSPDQKVLAHRTKLADTYERVEIWDCARDVRRRIVETSSEPERQRARQRLQATVERTQSNQPNIILARDRFLREADRYRNDPDLVPSVTVDHIDQLIARERGK